jgi:hypothetical protein
MLLNSDGSPYRAVGSIQQFDPNNPEHYLFNLWDAEIIRMGGSPIYYYEVFIQLSTLDELYREDRGKLWSPVPVELYATYEPVPAENFQNQFGIDAPTELKLELNYKEALDRIGHPPKIGSRIHTPHKREDWVIIQRNTGEYKLWGEIRLELLCSRFQESVTTGEGKVTQKKPDFEIN